MSIPSKDALLQLHACLLKKVPEDTPDEMANALLPWLIEQLTRAYPSVSDPHLIDEAAADALWAYLRQPEKYQPERSALTTYLTMAARRDLLNKFQKQKRAAAHEKNLEEGVELEAVGGNTTMEDDLETREAAHRASDMMEKKITDEVDKKMLELMMNGERKTSEFANVLGIEAWPPDRQAREVKRVKDRLKKVLSRLKGDELHVD